MRRLSLVLIALATFLCVSAATFAEDTSPDSGEAPTSGGQSSINAGHSTPNRLAKESSPYLLLHAHNPVDWYPWGPEAFEKARTENKPIFLSIGYSSCYWCHVMERETFSDEEIARFMNAHFVCIKVDREERPDVDDIYMTALQIYLQATGSGQGGGWPLSMFLTPDGKPIGGGTYFPPRDKPGQGGFLSLLSQVNKLWNEREKSLRANGELFASETRRAMQPSAIEHAVELDASLVDKAIVAVTQEYDPEYGGLDFDPRRPTGPEVPGSLTPRSAAVNDRRTSRAEPRRDGRQHSRTDASRWHS